MKSISQILSGLQNINLEISLEPNEIASFRYAPVTNCDVERSFSQYKAILRDNRHRLNDTTIKNTVISHYNLNLIKKL